MTNMGKAAALVGVIGMLAVPSARPSLAQQPADQAAFQTPADVLRALYAGVTFEPGTLPDWDQVRSLFLGEATILLRTTRTATTVFSVDGFVDDFVSFIAQANLEQRGFVERIVRTRSWAFRDMAHVLVLYEACIPGSGREPQQGIDSFLLTRRDGRWWIAALTNDIVDAEHPVPAELRDPGNGRGAAGRRECVPTVR